MRTNILFRSIVALSFICINLSSAQGLSPKEFNFINQENIVWNSFPAFPEKVKLAILVGNPTKAEPFIVRVKVPNGEKIMPHVHPEDRIYTVILGVFYIGIGEKYDENKLQAYPPGSVVVLPGNTPHFHFAKSGEYITQVYAIGPLGLDYLDKEFDPRLKSK
jgi:quercetin dioxygenase-like cupin family protein